MSYHEHGLSRVRRAASAALVALVLPAAGCVTTVPAPPVEESARPSAHGSAGPAAKPTGALHGRVLDGEGAPVTGTTVSLYQHERTDLVRGLFAVASLGLLCLIPGVCPAPVQAELSATGHYAFPKRVMKDTPQLTLAVESPHDGPLTGSRSSATLAAGKKPQRAPDLTLWEPELSIKRTGRRAVLSWPRLRGAAAGRAVRYTVLTRSIGRIRVESDWHPVVERTKRTRARLDLRRYEDQATEVAVLASTKAKVDGKKVAFGYRSAGHRLPLFRPPPSRDRPCLVGKGSGRLVPARRPCPLTDGDLRKHDEVLAKGACSVNDKDCEATSYRRVCVGLGSRRKVRLIVFRTPFELRAKDIAVELSANGRRFQTVGKGAQRETVTTPVRPARTARIVCLRGEFRGSILRELSVW